MFSNRIFNTDMPYNYEGMKNHHIADGATFIFRTGGEYRNIFPVWDWRDKATQVDPQDPRGHDRTDRDPI